MDSYPVLNFNCGLNHKEVIDWINEHGNMDIKYSFREVFYE